MERPILRTLEPSKLRVTLNQMTYQDVSGVGDGSDDSGSNHKLLPGLGEVDDVNSFIVALEHVWVHQV